MGAPDRSIIGCGSHFYDTLLTLGVIKNGWLNRAEDFVNCMSTKIRRVGSAGTRGVDGGLGG